MSVRFFFQNKKFVFSSFLLLIPIFFLSYLENKIIKICLIFLKMTLNINVNVFNIGRNKKFSKKKPFGNKANET